MNPARKFLAGGAIAAALITGGAIGASVVGVAGAASSATTTAPAAATTAPAPPQGRQAPDWSKGGHQANGITEALLTGSAKAKATAAAEAAVPGATVQRVENDAEGATYEVHMTKADGSIVTVKLDGNFTVTATLDGMG